MSRPLSQRARLGVLALAALAIVPLGAATAEAAKKKGVPVKVMTRNVFLGADLAPALEASNFHEFIEANGAIMREVDLTNFPLRAQALGDEILAKRPHLVGLQEVAHWRTGPTAVPPTLVDPSNPPYGATTTKYDFLALLLAQLEGKYKVAVEKPEFDFEAPADYNDVDNDAPPAFQSDGDPSANDEGPNSTDDAELNGRLTMRDVILVRKGKRVKAKNPTSGTYSSLYTPNVAGIDIPVQRGWTAVDVVAKKGTGERRQRVKFDFVNTHFEAFDDETQVPSIRAQQASEVASGPASGKRVVLLGDFNSNVPGVQPGDEQAFQVLLDAGFKRRSTQTPASCCVSDLFTSPPTEFDHVVDHVVANHRKIKKVSSSVTGLAQVNGIYPSDHAGVFSKLRIKK